MNIAKDEVRSFLDKLPDEYALDDIQYHFYVVEKIRKGFDRANAEGLLSQNDVEKTFSKWTT